MLARCGRRVVGRKLEKAQKSPSQTSGHTSSHAHGHTYSHGESSRDTHLIQVSTDVRPGDWFRASLPGYSPPRWIVMQLPAHFASGSDLEVKVPRLRESVYATQAKRGPLKRALCTFVPTVHLVFIWVLVRRPAHVKWSRL
jgi:hypothetical protein